MATAVLDFGGGVAVAVAAALLGHVFVTLGVSLALAVLTVAVRAAVGVTSVGVADACGQAVDRGSVGSSDGVQLDVAVAVGCGVRLGNGHHVGHQLGVGEAD